MIGMLKKSTIHLQPACLSITLPIRTMAGGIARSETGTLQQKQQWFSNTLLSTNRCWHTPIMSFVSWFVMIDAAGWALGFACNVSVEWSSISVRGSTARLFQQRLSSGKVVWVAYWESHSLSWAFLGSLAFKTGLSSRDPGTWEIHHVSLCSVPLMSC